MVELVVLACLMNQPEHCEEFHMPFLQPMAVTECVTRQPTFEIVRWATEHPEWRILKWTCGPPRA